ncbi:MAG TPA: class I SAM-dependent methyltransferase [Kineosporiaceae bacterium]|nr:class I SAM-dependent methyltransferase [Kineosporiaceae bacterium]
MDGDPFGPLETAGYSPAGPEESARGNRHWWDREAVAYLDEHGAVLGRDDFVWGPEGLREDEAGLLGDVRGLDVLEVGCGAGQCTRWLLASGARAAGLDLSAGMLRSAGGGPFVQADARRLPFADASFDVACSAYGAVPFVADPGRIMTEVARVLRPGGRWVFSVTHPVRWAFPDDPGPAGLTASRSYFDRTPYVELDAAGTVLYAEHHRTLADRVADLVAAGFTLERLVEPEWPVGAEHVWGGWSALRGRLLPGTLVLAARRSAGR